MQDVDDIDTTIDTDQARIEEMANIPEEEVGIDGNDQQGNKGEGSEGVLDKKKRAMRSKIWTAFTKSTDANGLTSVKCNFCGLTYSWQKSGTTSHLGRHMGSCIKRKLHLKKQGLLNFQPSDTKVSVNLPALAAAIVDGKYDPLKMREAICHWVLMHEHPFSVVDEDGFNFMMKIAIPQFEKIARATLKSDCMKIYEHEKKKGEGHAKESFKD